MGRGGQKRDRLQDVVGRHRHHGVQLEVTTLAGKRHRGVVAHHLGHHLDHRFRDHRVYLARHDGTARLHLRQSDLPQSRPRPRGDEPDVVGDLVQADGDGFEHSAGLNQRVQRGLGLEVVGRFLDQHSGSLRDGLAGPGGEFHMGVHAGAHRGAAQGNRGQRLLGPVQPLHAVFGLPGESLELLPQPDRRCVLQVGAAGFDDGPELVRFLVQFIGQKFQGRNQVLFDGEQRRQVDGRGYDVVGGLAHVHMVVGVDQFGAQVSAQDLAGPVGDDLVGVGVGGGAGAGLEDVQNELLVQRAVDDFLRGRYHGVSSLLIQQAQGHVGLGRGLFHQAQGPDERAGEDQAADGEVQHRPHG